MSGDVFLLDALDYIRVQLTELAALKPIKLFIRGTFPLGNVPQQLAPYLEYYISQSQESPADTATRRDGILYTGGLRVINNLADNSGWLNRVDIGVGRVINLPGYTDMVTLIIAARNELLRCAHNDLGGLNVDDEWACAFSILSGSLGFGLEQGTRRNTWYDVAQLQFAIRVQREREA